MFALFPSRRSLNVCLVVSLALVTAGSASAQTNEWSWMGGGDTVSPPGQLGTLGTMGVPSAANIPGARWYSQNWTDHNGNFWLFGGITYRGTNDLWKFNPSTNQWTFVNGTTATDDPGVYGTLGVPDVANVPGGRWTGVTSTDKSGNLWLFGGFQGNCNSDLNDLWRYNIAANEWTWMSGSNQCDAGGVYGTYQTPSTQNTPAARENLVSWTDKNGNFWLFGGRGYDGNGGYGLLNDLWEYNPSTNEWAWQGGSSSADSSGVYGTLGTAAAGNNPGGRWGLYGWTDNNGTFWLMGGEGYDISGNYGQLNDVWKFDPSTKLWAWMSGPQTATDAPPVYGTLGVPAPENTPGAVYGRPNTWTDNSDNLWLFGGTALDGGSLNTLWEYSTSTNQWTWKGGSSTSENDSGVYGTLATPAPGNIPGARAQSLGWVDTSGNLWLFGGGPQALDVLGNSGNLNDLWKYQLSSATLPAAAKPVFSVADGTYTTVQTVTLSDATAGATIYYSTNGASAAPTWTVYTAPIIVSSTQTIEAIAMASGDSTSPVANAAYTINLPAGATTTALSTSAYPYVTGSPITFTAVVSSSVGYPTPSGTVQFEANGAALGAPVALDPSGTATYATNALPVGYLSITAVYTTDNPAVLLSSTSNVLTEAVYSSPRQTDNVSFVSAVQTLGSGFKQPYAVAVDAHENVFVADTGNHALKLMLAAGGYQSVLTVSTLFQTPSGLALDSSGNLFVSDRSSSTVYELPVYTAYATFVDLNRDFSEPTGLAVDASGDLIVADTGHGVVKLVPACFYCQGGYSEATTLGSKFPAPWGVAVDGAGNIFVTDVENHTISELTVASKYATVNPVGSSFFQNPYGLAADTNGDLFVTDVSGGTLREVSELDGFTTVSTPASGLNVPIGVAVDATGNLFVADTLNNAVKKISQTGGNFGLQGVGTKSGVISMTFLFNQPATLGSRAVLAQQDGAASADFADAGTGTCKAGTAYVANASCTVDITFKPTQTGTLTGVIELLDNSAKVLALGSVQGSGN